MRVIDADGQMIAYVHQKLFKFKEEIIVYRDQTKSQELYRIKADKIIDWSPTYSLYSPDGRVLASTKREGAKSLFNATYHLNIGETRLATLKEQNPWVKFLDALLGSIPLIDIVSGYFINPKYELKDDSGQIMTVLAKRPAFFEGFYEIEQGTIASHPEETQEYTALLLMLIAMMERYRG